MDNGKEIKTYVIQRVSFGDRPSGTITTVALRKTAEMEHVKYPQEGKIIKDNTYMNDIIESVGDRKRAESVTQNIEKLVDIGGFKIKCWTNSGNSGIQNEKEILSETSAPAEKVLGVCWRPVNDQFCSKVTLNFSGRKRKRLACEQARKLHTEPDIESHQLTERFPSKLTK